MKLTVALSIGSLALPAPAQDPQLRSELLARIRDCEAQLMRHAERWAGSGAVEHVQAGAGRFFEDDLPGACSELSSAAAIAERGRAASVDGMAFHLRPRLLDLRDLTLELEWTSLEQKRAMYVWWTRLALSNGVTLSTDNFPIDRVGLWELSFECDRPCDLRATCELGDFDFRNFERVVSLSIVERRDERLAALKSAIDAASEKGPKLEVGTAAMLSALLNSLASASTEEHDYPGARLLAEAEQVVAAAAKGERWYGPQRDGEFWLALPVGAAGVRTRVLVPSGLAKDKPAPLVLALHGRSFDEDTWFDGYGCGQSVELARKRGWVLAAPHCDGDEEAAKLEGIVKALADVYPIDMKRVMLLGHSRGGGSALAALAQTPNHFRAVATIGSALAPERASELTKRPLFLAVGDRDFARESVEVLHKAFSAANATNATFKLYPHVEHWLCVTVALPDVFAWFDAQQK